MQQLITVVSIYKKRHYS